MGIVPRGLNLHFALGCEEVEVCYGVFSQVQVQWSGGFEFVMQRGVFHHLNEEVVSQTSSCFWVVKLLIERIHFAGLPTLTHLTLFSHHTSILKKH